MINNYLLRQKNSSQLTLKLTVAKAHLPNIPLPIPIAKFWPRTIWVLSNIRDRMPHAIDKANNPKIPRTANNFPISNELGSSISNAQLSLCNGLVCSSHKFKNSPPPPFLLLTHLHKLRLGTKARHSPQSYKVSYGRVVSLDIGSPGARIAQVEYRYDMCSVINSKAVWWIARKASKIGATNCLVHFSFHWIYDGIGSGNSESESKSNSEWEWDPLSRRAAFGYTWIYLHNLQMFMALGPFRFSNKSRLCKYLIGMSATVTVFLR